MQFLRLLGPAEFRTAVDRDVPALLAQPKRLALLAYLAAARPTGFHRRDTLIGLFWPELDHARGRAALRQALYTIRRTAGLDVVSTRGDEEVGIDARLECDVIEFSRLRTTDPAAAMALYRGDLLQGLFIREAPEFEQWLEAERSRLRGEAALTAWQLAGAAAVSDPDAAIGWARRATALDPYDERAVRRLMQMFAELGQGASALRLYGELERLLARELETSPSAETQALAAALRVAPAPESMSAPASRGMVMDVAEATSPAALPARERSARRPRALVLALVAMLAVFAPVVYGMVSEPADAVVAVGALESYTGRPDSVTAVLRAMLASNLARIEGVEVISDTRLLQLSRGNVTRVGLANAARRAGAKRLLEGSVFTEGKGGLRLTLEWTDLRSGRGRFAGEVREENVFAVVNAATSELARSLNRSSPVLPFEQVTTHSLAAYRLFESGVRAYYRERHDDARVLLRQAVAADSEFAQAWWYYSRLLSDAERQDAAARAFRLADQATDRERLLIRAQYLADMDDPRALAVADTLSVRYPQEPSGLLLAGYTRMWQGDFTGALVKLRQAVHVDSASIGDSTVSVCYACQALWEMHSAYGLADSVAAQLRHAQAWVRLDPGARGAWFALSNALEASGRWREAIAPLQRGIAMVPVDTLNQALGELYIRAGERASADAFMLERVNSQVRQLRTNGLWLYIISLRNQGRYQEALRAAAEYRRIEEPGVNSLFNALPQAQVLLEMGRAREAAAIYDSVANVPFSRHSVARNARACTTNLGWSAEAYFAAGDAGALRRLLPEITSCARATSFGPGRLRPHYVRGLLLELEGDAAGAARAYRRALFAVSKGDTRVNYHLARVLLQQGRPREAVPVLNAALRGFVAGPGYNMTHRQLHELAAEAWRAAGRPDSAAAHLAWLARMTHHPADTRAVASQ